MTAIESIRRALAEPNALQGSCFDMCLTFAPGDLDGAIAARRALWSSGKLRGPVTMDGGTPGTARPVALDRAPLSELVYGTARLPNGAVIACMSFGYEPPSGERAGPYVDLTLYEGALRSVYPLGPLWPFDDGRNHAWVLELSEWFRDLADIAFRAAPFVAGCIGCEVGGSDAILRRGDVPGERWVGYLVPDGSTLAWFPPTVLRAPLGVGPSGSATDAEA